MVNTKIAWFDVLTPKQAQLFLTIGNRLKLFGFSSIYTTRKHDYTKDIFEYHQVQPNIFGEYGGKTLEGKLISSVKRVVELTEYIINFENKPIVAISLSSPDAARIAFGLGIPLILFNDTTHSKPVGKLTFSLANYLITPSCIDANEFIQLGANPNIIQTFNGIDEVEYTSGENYKTYIQARNEGSPKERYLIFRPEESFAAYMKEQKTESFIEILIDILKYYSGRIIVLPRYEKQREILKEKFDGKIEIPDKGMYFINMLANAEIVITGGGTMAREAALFGIPSITYFWRHLEPQKFIEERGFPSYSIQKISEVKKIIRKICLNPTNYWIDTSKQINTLEKPSSILLKIMKKDKILKKHFQ